VLWMVLSGGSRGQTDANVPRRAQLGRAELVAGEHGPDGNLLRQLLRRPGLRRRSASGWFGRTLEGVFPATRFEHVLLRRGLSELRERTMCLPRCGLEVRGSGLRSGAQLHELRNGQLLAWLVEAWWADAAPIL
jgi:hypothetical protein